MALTDIQFNNLDLVSQETTPYCFMYPWYHKWTLCLTSMLSGDLLLLKDHFYINYFSIHLSSTELGPFFATLIITCKFHSVKFNGGFLKVEGIIYCIYLVDQGFGEVGKIF